MFDKLDDLLVRFEELLNELGEPGVTDDPAHFQKLMKEQSDLQPIVDAYKEYKKNKETIEDSLSMLESEKDEEMREMLKEELSDARKRVEELEHELKIFHQYVQQVRKNALQKEARAEQSTKEHLAVMEAVKAHDADEADRLATRHILNSIKNNHYTKIEKLLEEQPGNGFLSDEK